MKKSLTIVFILFAINQKAAVDEHHGVRQRIGSLDQRTIDETYQSMYHRQIEALLNSNEISNKKTREAVHEEFKRRLSDPEIAVNINRKELLKIMTDLAEGRITKLKAFLAVASAAAVSALLAALITFHTA